MEKLLSQLKNRIEELEGVEAGLEEVVLTISGEFHLKSIRQLLRLNKHLYKELKAKYSPTLKA